MVAFLNSTERVMNEFHFRNTKEAAELQRLADTLEASATESAQAAAAAKRSAFWTMIAAIVSAVGVVLSTVAALGMLDWAKPVAPTKVMPQSPAVSAPGQTNLPTRER